MKSVKEQKSYGCIKLRLREYLDERGIKRGTLASHADTRYDVINKWYDSNLERMDLDVLARICYALDCDISDLLVYHADDTNE